MDRRIHGFDGLRALAVLGVVIVHLWPRPSLLIDSFPFGVFGVTFFFVLSGFLLTGILLDAPAAEGWHKTIGYFYARRSLRTFPIYYLLVLVCAGLGLAEARHNFVWLLSYAMNYDLALNGPGDYRVLGHVWTLCVEEQFYLLLPPLVIFCRQSWAAGWLGLLLVLSLIIKVVLAYSGYPVLAVNRTLWGSDEGLILGCLLAYAWREERWRGLLLQIAPFFIVAGLAAYYLLTAGDLVRVMAFRNIELALVAAGLVIWVAGRPASRLTRLLELPPLRYMGRISYGIYLYHPIVGMLLVMAGAGLGLVVDNTQALFWMGLLATVALAALSYRFIEIPLLAQKRFFR